MTATTSPALARTGPWVLITAILGSALVFVDSMVVTLALPVMQADLDARLADLQWVLSGYTLMLAALILVGGTLGDAFGRRRVFVAGVAGFVAASLACGLARDIEQLIAARVVQGLAGAALVPAAMALISTAYPNHRRGWAFGIWAAAAASTIAAAPVLGGLIVQALSWRWIFFINLPLGLAVIILAMAKVPETRNPNQAAGFDLAGAATATVGLGALAYGLIAAGDGAARAWPALAIAALALGGFVAVEWRNPKAMLPLALFASPTFSGISLITVLYWGSLTAVSLFLPMLFIQVLGYSPVMAGLGLAPIAAISAVLSPRVGRLTDRVGARALIVAGAVATMAGYLLLLRAGPAADYGRDILPGLVFIGLGIAGVAAPSTVVAMNAVETTRAGLASGVSNALSRVAQLLAIAGFGALALTWFDGALTDQLMARGLGADVIAAAERAKLAGAAPPSGLDPALGAMIEGAIHGAFSAAFRVVMATCAGFSALSALIAWATLAGRRREKGDDLDP